MTDPPNTQEQLDELAKLAPRVDRPDAEERFKRTMRQLFGAPKDGAEPPELATAEDYPAAPDPCDDRARVMTTDSGFVQRVYYCH